jgi:hypothetical protein
MYTAKARTYDAPLIKHRVRIHTIMRPDIGAAHTYIGHVSCLRWTKLYVLDFGAVGVGTHAYAWGYSTRPDLVVLGL